MELSSLASIAPAVPKYNVEQIAVRALNDLVGATNTPELTLAYAAQLQPAADAAVALVRAAQPMFSRDALRLPLAEASVGAAMLNRITRSNPMLDAYSLKEMFLEANRSFRYAASDVTMSHALLS